MCSCNLFLTKWVFFLNIAVLCEMNWEKIINSYFKIAVSFRQRPGCNKTANFIWIAVIPKKKQDILLRTGYYTHSGKYNEVKSKWDNDSAKLQPQHQTMNKTYDSHYGAAHHWYLSMSPSLSILFSRSRYLTARTSRISRIRLLQFRKR